MCWYQCQEQEISSHSHRRIRLGNPQGNGKLSHLSRSPDRHHHFDTCRLAGMGEDVQMQHHTQFHYHWCAS